MKQYTSFFFISIFTCIIALYSGCEIDSRSSDTLFSLVNEKQSGLSFINEVKNTRETNVFKYRNFYNGGGVAIGDINADGLPDVYLTANQKSNKLFLNLGGFTFKDITAEAGTGGTKPWSTGAVMVDVNADGHLDIYVCNAGTAEGENRKNELFINNGDMTFNERAAEYGLDQEGFTTHAAFFDYDRDGDLDAYILNNSFIPVTSLNYSNKRHLQDQDWDVAPVLKGGGDKLLRNDNGSYIDVSQEAGIYGSLIGFGLGVTVGDINGDYYPDLYISNDFYERDYLYINQQDGTFKEELKKWISHTSLASMGADMADINNDGRSDIFVTDMLPEPDKRLKETTKFEDYDLYQRKVNLDFHHQLMQNTLQLNVSEGRFAEIAHYSGVSKTDWSWGALMFDMDNDGYRDILVCNGIYHDLTNQDFINFFANDVIQEMAVYGKKREIEEIIEKMPSTPIPNYALKNKKNLTFVNHAKEWGLAKPSFSNGAAYGDLDNDGDLDLIINTMNQPTLVYENHAKQTYPNRHHINIRLLSSPPNTYAVGSVIETYAGNEVIRHEVIPSRGFQSSVDYTQVVGVGETDVMDSIRIVWHDHTTHTLYNVATDTTLVIQKDNNISQNTLLPTHRISYTKKWMKQEASSSLMKHEENFHVDFDYEGTISRMLSKEGPALAVADMKADARADVFVGGAAGQPSRFYSQKTNGEFILRYTFEDSKPNEDVVASFADINNDGYQDIVVGTGGNQPSSRLMYGVRVYLGKPGGRYEDPEWIIRSQSNISTIEVCDYDNDGDTDIFVGSRSMVGIYGVAAPHYLLENQGDGSFTNVINKKAYPLVDYGMITSAKWSDLNQDNMPDLVVVGDWATPLVLLNNGKQLVPQESNLDSLAGWWSAIEIADVNNDGKPDLILGNLGENVPYKATKDAVCKLYINDFDNNGTIEQISTLNQQGRDLPIVLKDEMTRQLVSLKKQNLAYGDYAQKSIDQLFDAKILEQSIVRVSNTSSSVVAIQSDNGRYEVRKLPPAVQFSSVRSILALDINGDTHIDLLTGGNEFELKPQYGRYDTDRGNMLLGDGEGNFEVVGYAQSGFELVGQVRRIVEFRNKSEKKILAISNNRIPQLFTIRRD